MRGKKGFRQTRNRDIRVVFAGIDGDAIKINTATPTSLNNTNPTTIFSGFQTVALPQNTPTITAPTIQLANDGNRFALLSYMPPSLGVTATESQILVSLDAKTWRTRTLPTRNTTDAIKHAWAEVYGINGRFIVSHSHYPDIVISDNNNSWILLQDVFAVNGFQPNNIVFGAGKLIAAADDAKVIYQSTDNGATWTQVASGITINESTAAPQSKALDQILALTYGPDGAANVFFMLARRSDVARYRYVLTSPDGVTWTQRLRIDLGTTGTPQEPLIAASPTRVVVLWNNLTTATTLITTTSASTWTQLTNTPAANWRTLIYDGNKFVAAGEPFSTAAAPIVMTFPAAGASLVWSVKLTDTQKLRAASVGSSTQIQPDNAVTLLLRMNGAVNSNVFVDSSPNPKTVTAQQTFLSAAQTKWPGSLSAVFDSSKFLRIAQHPDIIMGTADFTMEAWVWLTEFGWPGQWFWLSSKFRWDFGNNGSLRASVDNGITYFVTTPEYVVPLQTWTHAAIVRQNNKITIYVNGEAKASAAYAFDDDLLGEVQIGRYINGYIGEYRVTKGAAVYTTPTFDVPTAPLPAFTTLGRPNALSFSPAAANQIVINWLPAYAPSGVTVTDYLIQHSTDDGVTWVNAETTTKTNASATVINLLSGIEYKFRIAAVTEDGTGLYSPVSAGAVPGIDPYLNRVSLLLKFNTADNAFIDSSPESKQLFITGLVTLSNAQSRWGDGSAQFAGGTILLNSSAAFGFSTGDFTIEFWAFPAEQTLAGGIINVGYYYAGILFRQRVYDPNAWWLSPGDSLYFNDAWVNWNSEQNMPSNVWTHIALVRESGMVSVYANGVRVLNYAQPADLGTSQFVTIGAGAHSGLDEPFIGYLDDLRITKGVARYSGPNAQIPTGPF